MSFVVTEKSGMVLTLRLDRPEKLNALNEEMRLELISHLRDANSDPSIRCVVLTGSGKAFCVGADLASVKQDLGRDLAETFHPVLNEIRFGPKIYLSAVNGVAAGAGISIALAADIRFCSAASRFVTAFHNVGLAPDTGLSFMLPRMMAAGKAIDLLIRGGEFNASEAEEYGLFRISDDPLNEALKEAEIIASGPFLSHVESKRLVNKAVFDGIAPFLLFESDSQGRLGRTLDHEEGKRAFSEKRKPSFRGE